MSDVGRISTTELFTYWARDLSRESNEAIDLAEWIEEASNAVPLPHGAERALVRLIEERRA